MRASPLALTTFEILLSGADIKILVTAPTSPLPAFLIDGFAPAQTATVRQPPK
jgi:hypothetical protein